MVKNELVKRKIDTMDKKLEYMYVRLGGEDLENGKELKGLKNLDQYQGMVIGIKNKINRIKEDIEKRKENIKIHGYQNKDRIVADLRIRKSIDEAEEEINTVEILVKKKAASYSKEDLNNRNKTIGLLRKNLMLLRDDIMGDKANVSVDQDAPNKIFGDYNNTDSDQISPKQVKVDLEGEEEKYVDRELTEEEKQALVQFKKNDEELDKILDKVIAGLGQLEEKGNQLHEGIERQNELLKKTNKKVEKTNLRLRQQNNHLKDVLQKIRSTNKLCCDLCLVLCFLGLCGVIVAVLNSKNYF
ncbi:unnamed protein product [Moneuplotes crassus]|uniref:t-SNARE coiled-coil homology domain-containing protein n=1 Tax=Euplotes crassus TaxID=5936 RepID=A0AAD1XPM6_EUPCR|nr:unnamed protein product [Moneuplotes crassus]